MIVCKACGESFQRLMAQAMAVDLGAKIYPSPLECHTGQKHEFVNRKIVKKQAKG